MRKGGCFYYSQRCRISHLFISWWPSFVRLSDDAKGIFAKHIREAAPNGGCRN